VALREHQAAVDAKEGGRRGLVDCEEGGCNCSIGCIFFELRCKRREG
jgi:hypothetical protein